MPQHRDSFFDRPILLGDLFTKYKAVVWLIVGFLVAAGFGFQTPAHRFNEIEKANKAELQRIDRKADSLAVVIRELRPMIETSAIISCLSVSDRNASYLITCKRLLNQFEGGRD